MTELTLATQTLDRLSADVLVAPFFFDERPLRGPAALLDWRLDGQLTGLLQQGAVTGRAGEQVLLQSSPKLAGERILFVGGGSWQGLAPEAYRGLLEHVLNSCRRAGFRRVALGLAPLPEQDPQALTQMLQALLADGTELPGECQLAISLYDTNPWV